MSKRIIDTALYFTTDRGVPMAAVETDSRFSDDALVIKFFDLRYAFLQIPGTEARGQFTGGSYFQQTLLRSQGSGLMLDGDISDWTIDAENFERIQKWIVNLMLHDDPKEVG